MQVKLSEEQSMRLIVHLFEIGALTDENNITPKSVSQALYTRYHVKLVPAINGKKTTEAIQGLERDVSRVISALVNRANDTPNEE